MEDIRQKKFDELQVLILKARPMIFEAMLAGRGALESVFQEDASSSDLLHCLTKLKHVLSVLCSFENNRSQRGLLVFYIATLTRLLDRRAAAYDTSPVAEAARPSDRMRSDEQSVSSNFCVISPREVLTTWGDVIGADEAIATLKQAVVLPRKMPHLFTGARKPWGCILLYGPPGTGKTLLASATAAEAGIAFIPVSASDLLSKWVGDTEKMIRELFETASQAGRCIVFLDEIDALCASRGGDGESEASRRAKTEFLVRMQSVDSRYVTILAATNLPWELDVAFRRRFDRVIFVGLPKSADRLRILQHYLTGVDHCISQDELYRLCDSLDGYSPCDIAHVTQHAAMMPIERLQSATHYRYISSTPSSRGLVHEATQPAPTQPIHLEPCDPSDVGAFPSTIEDIDPLLLRPRPVTSSDVIAAIAACPMTVSPAYIARYPQWEQSLRLR